MARLFGLLLFLFASSGAIADDWELGMMSSEGPDGMAILYNHETERGKDKGFSTITLECHDDSFHIVIEMKYTFEGMVFVNNNQFRDFETPCMLGVDSSEQDSDYRTFRMEVPFDPHTCYTYYKDGVFKNVLVIQHDRVFKSYSDAYFDIECSYDHYEKETTVKGKAFIQEIEITDEFVNRLRDPPRFMRGENTGKRNSSGGYLGNLQVNLHEEL
ncbi:uncharacterized protein LOC109604366 [Aethina tumida]|uniref:uncharacterized protein LOC109604366 n=1 Tax=Aethina tumida TaxID=116153 RepID=UPI00096AF860|nr:uncharacterized protein LOC109604366 [Aethina tumida]